SELGRTSTALGDDRSGAESGAEIARQMDEESSAVLARTVALDAVVSGDSSAVSLDRAMDDRQAEAHPPGARVPYDALKELRADRGRDPGAVVCHVEVHLALVGLDADLHPRAGMAERVAEQVRQHADEVLSVAPDELGGGRLDLDDLSARFGRAAQPFGDAAGEGREVDPLDAL